MEDQPAAKPLPDRTNPEIKQDAGCNSVNLSAEVINGSEHLR